MIFLQDKESSIHSVSRIMWTEWKKTIETQDVDFNGICFVNLVDFDMVYGHRNNRKGYAEAATTFDRQLGTFMERMAALAGVARKDILAHDLYVYSRTPGTIWGASGEYISAVVWTICSVHSRHWKVSYRHRTEKVFRFTVSLTMKKWEVSASRGLLLHCFAIR